VAADAIARRLSEADPGGLASGQFIFSAEIRQTILAAQEGKVL
jgi:hypothetical protein